MIDYEDDDDEHEGKDERVTRPGTSVTPSLTIPEQELQIGQGETLAEFFSAQDILGEPTLFREEIYGT
jgi:hypothetical protein